MAKGEDTDMNSPRIKKGDRERITVSEPHVTYWGGTLWFEKDIFSKHYVITTIKARTLSGLDELVEEFLGKLEVMLAELEL